MNISQAEVLSHEYIQKFECNMKYLLFVNSQGKNTKTKTFQKSFSQIMTKSWQSGKSRQEVWCLRFRPNTQYRGDTRMLISVFGNEVQQQIITQRLFLPPNFKALNSFKQGNMYKKILMGKLEECCTCPIQCMSRKCYRTGKTNDCKWNTQLTKALSDKKITIDDLFQK